MKEMVAPYVLSLSLPVFALAASMEKRMIAAWLVAFLAGLYSDTAQTQVNPETEAAGIGIVRTVEIKTGEGYVTGTESIQARITVLEVLRGDRCWQLLMTSIPGNKPPEAGMEYIAARIRFEYVMQGTGDRSYAVRDEQFALFSQNGRQYNRPSIAHPRPELGGRLYPGDSLEGWLSFQVSTEDDKPLMSFGNNYNKAWFKLY